MSREWAAGVHFWPNLDLPRGVTAIASAALLTAGLSVGGVAPAAHPGSVGSAPAEPLTARELSLAASVADLTYLLATTAGSSVNNAWEKVVDAFISLYGDGRSIDEIYNYISIGSDIDSQAIGSAFQILGLGHYLSADIDRAALVDVMEGFIRYLPLSVYEQINAWNLDVPYATGLIDMINGSNEDFYAGLPALLAKLTSIDDVEAYAFLTDLLRVMHSSADQEHAFGVLNTLIVDIDNLTNAMADSRVIGAVGGWLGWGTWAFKSGYDMAKHGIFGLMGLDQTQTQNELDHDVDDLLSKFIPFNSALYQDIFQAVGGDPDWGNLLEDTVGCLVSLGTCFIPFG